MTTSILEDMVFSKPYFDSQGMRVAEWGQSIVGMALVGFIPNEAGDDLNRQQAVISRLLVESEQPDDVADQLLAECESYAKRAGARSICYGSRFPDAPFLNGAYGGSLVPGVLESELGLFKRLREHGYTPGLQIDSFHRLLADFRPLVNRQQITVKRQCRISMEADPKPGSWFQACLFGLQNCVDFLLLDRKTAERCGNLRFWEIQPLSGMWGRRSAGLYFLEIAPELRRTGLATMLLGEAFRELRELGFASVEIQLPRGESAFSTLFQKLGFEHIGRGTQMLKSW